MIVRKTRPNEARRVNELFAIAFELPAEDGPADPEETGVTSWAAFDDSTGEMMSTFAISDFHIRFDGHRCLMGGVGGVASLPQYRRRGGIRGCFREALPDLYRRGYDFAYLYPFSTAYYRRFGFECCVQKMHVCVHLGMVKSPHLEGYFRLSEANCPQTEAIRKVDSCWEQRYNMMVLHDEGDYDWTKKVDPAGKQEFTYVYYDAQNQPKAYTTFRKIDQPDGRNLVCSRFFFLDREGFWGLMQLFQSLSSDHMFLKFALPVTSSMEFLFPEWSMGAFQSQILNAGMVRVICAEKVLKKAACVGSGRLTVALTDSQIPENNGCFAVTFADGQVQKVEKTDEKPDVSLDIAAFSALIAGALSFDAAAQWLPGVQIHNPSACFSQIFYPKPLMIADYF